VNISGAALGAGKGKCPFCPSAIGKRYNYEKDDEI
jgi:hypothetical protein